MKYANSESQQHQQHLENNRTSETTQFLQQSDKHGSQDSQDLVGNHEHPGSQLIWETWEMKTSHHTLHKSKHCEIIQISKVIRSQHIRVTLKLMATIEQY